MKKAKRITAFFLCLAVILAGSGWLAWRMMPQRPDYGATWHRYRKEEKNTVEVLFIGSSIAYCDIMPAVIYEQTGIPSYLVCGPELTASLSYYYLKEALRTQSPKLVYLDAYSFFFGKYTSYTKVNVGYMPHSQNRLAATFRAAEKEERLGLLLPITGYHSRWEEMTLKKLFGPRRDCSVDMNAGYTKVEDTEYQQFRKERVFSVTEEELEENLKWLEKIIRLCQRKGIELRLLVEPSCSYPSEEMIGRLTAHAPGVPIVNYNDRFDELGLALASDYHDVLHLNYQGALKFSKTVAEDIAARGLTPCPHDEALWRQRVEEK